MSVYFKDHNIRPNISRNSQGKSKCSNALFHVPFTSVSQNTKIFCDKCDKQNAKVSAIPYKAGSSSHSAHIYVWTYVFHAKALHSFKVLVLLFVRYFSLRQNLQIFLILNMIVYFKVYNVRPNIVGPVKKNVRAQMHCFTFFNRYSFHDTYIFFFLWKKSKIIMMNKFLNN